MTTPSKIIYHKRSKALEVGFADISYQIPAELLRVYSPSAEVRGHGSGQRQLQLGKKHIGIQAIEPVGNYAIRIIFDDGHDSGLFAWEFLEELGRDQVRFLKEYLDEMKAANASRLPTIPVGHWKPSNS
jgi:DUF971 family protein